jgi:glutamate-1-semialdehyde 2,1-aminomutase
MSAVRFARGFAKKDKIIKFCGGCYQWSFRFFNPKLVVEQSLLVRQIVRVAGTAKDTLLATYNDLENVAASLIAANKKMKLFVSIGTSC